MLKYSVLSAEAASAVAAQDNLLPFLVEQDENLKAIKQLLDAIEEIDAPTVVFSYSTSF